MDYAAHSQHIIETCIEIYSQAVEFYRLLYEKQNFVRGVSPDTFFDEGQFLKRLILDTYESARLQRGEYLKAYPIREVTEDELRTVVNVLFNGEDFDEICPELIWLVYDADDGVIKDKRISNNYDRFTRVRQQWLKEHPDWYLTNVFLKTT